MRVDLYHVSKKIRNAQIIQDVSFSLEAGDVLGLIGPNGAGKTSLLKLIGGLSFVTSGQVLFDGKPLEANQKNPLGMLIGNPSFYNHLTAFQNVNIDLLLKGLKKSERKHTAQQALAAAGLENVANKKLKEYSLGMRQRLGIEMLLFNDPDVLLMDEPINGLDPDGIQYVRELILKMSEKGKIIIVSSHILSELSQLCNKLCFIKNGRIVKILAGGYDHQELEMVYKQIMQGDENNVQNH